jgi:hypothetical protein
LVGWRGPGLCILLVGHGNAHTDNAPASLGIMNNLLGGGKRNLSDG